MQTFCASVLNCTLLLPVAASSFCYSPVHVRVCTHRCGERCRCKKKNPIRQQRMIGVGQRCLASKNPYKKCRGSGSKYQLYGSTCRRQHRALVGEGTALRTTGAFSVRLGENCPVFSTKHQEVPKRAARGGSAHPNLISHKRAL
ncbi:hypothetical protein J3E68DRAFT_406354 [Trichoderma sp. SZMC 28012]